ncbi:MAG: argininosuccinate lyase [Balneolaceae bacterium]|nr:MAG: argininosuccinate lyase [Balneolaceae bacterium]
MSKLWQSNAAKTQSDTAKKVEAFTVGNDYELDQQLVRFDIKASKVHARALERAGILTETELQKLLDALTEVESSWEAGNFEISIENEDMHTAIENALIEKLGDLGKKIHTGRSRNDQVLTAVRLYEKEAVSKVADEIKKTSELLLDFAEQHKEIPMPGFTHTRKAMLSSVALWAGAFAEMLIMQLNAAKGVESLINYSPLGSAAGFGTTFDIDREFEAKELGFSGPLICSTTAQLSRGWVELQFVQFLTAMAVVLNRFAADVIQFSSESTPLFKLDEVVCTGSSIMPQKKNPDVAELIRGRFARVAGQAAILQSVITNLGSGYHRDLQLTKEPVIKAVSDTLEMLEAVQILVSNLEPDREALEAACTSELFAAEAANKLVKEKGVSFREAYHIIKTDPDITKSLHWSEMMKSYSHLGSPGNPGTEDLRERLNSLQG